MRYDTPIYMRQITKGAYDKTTGNYGEDSIQETEVYASVMDTGADMLNLIYGKIIEGSLTIHLQNHYQDPFDRIRIGNKMYSVDRSRRLRTKQIYIVSEVQK